MKLRNNTIDILRVLGLLLVISAHCSFGTTFNNIRSFDVVLLVCMSTFSFLESNKEIASFEDYRYYLCKRFKRIVLPVWIFLTAYFIFFNCLAFIIKFPYTNIITIIESYLLLGGNSIGYVWIFRVLFINALIDPLLVKFTKYNTWINIGICLALLIGNDFFNSLLLNSIGNGSTYKIINTLVSYTIGYAGISFIAMNFYKSNTKKFSFCIFTLTILILSCYILQTLNIENYKFPPQVPYIFYGLSITFILYILFDKINIQSKLMTCVSMNSMSIYMAHIFFNTILYYFDVNLTSIVKFVFVTGLSIGSIIVLNFIKKGFKNGK